MHPILFTIPVIDFPIYTFAVLTLVSVMLSLQYINFESKRRGLDGETNVNFAIEVFLAGLIGTRLLFVAMNWSDMNPPGTSLPRMLFNTVNLRNGGLVWYAGPITATLYYLWRNKKFGLNTRIMADIFVVSVPLGHAVGRIGCFMVGDDFGRVWTPDSSWPEWATVTFTHKEALLPEEFKGKPLLPSQLLMSLGNWVIFGILFASRKRLARYAGCGAALYFILYALHRFLVEFTRGDEIRGFLYKSESFELATSQGIALALLPLGLLCFWYFYTHPVSDADLAPNDLATYAALEGKQQASEEPDVQVAKAPPPPEVKEGEAEGPGEVGTGGPDGDEGG